jgi:hypothetical protein
VKEARAGRVYASSNRQLTVTVPPISALSVRDGTDGPLHFVEFESELAHYLKKSDKRLQFGPFYSIEWFPAATMFPNYTSAKEIIVNSNKHIIKTKFKDSTSHYESQTCKPITINQTSGYQCIAKGIIDNVPGFIKMTTFILSGQFINAYVAYYPEQKDRVKQDFDNMVNSIVINN